MNVYRLLYRWGNTNSSANKPNYCWKRQRIEFNIFRDRNRTWESKFLTIIATCALIISAHVAECWISSAGRPKHRTSYTILIYRTSSIECRNCLSSKPGRRFPSIFFLFVDGSPNRATDFTVTPAWHPRSVCRR